MPKRSTHEAMCHLGVHRASAARWRDGEILRSRCTCCGGQLFRIGANRRWIFSGILGDTLEDGGVRPTDRQPRKRRQVNRQAAG